MNAISSPLTAEQQAARNSVVTTYPITVMGYQVRRQGDLVIVELDDDQLIRNYGMTLAELEAAIMDWLDESSEA